MKCYLKLVKFGNKEPSILAIEDAPIGEVIKVLKANGFVVIEIPESEAKKEIAELEASWGQGDK